MKNPIEDKKITERGWMSYRVKRGGSWRDSAQYVRVSSRSLNAPTFTFGVLGFRIVRNQK